MERHPYVVAMRAYLDGIQSTVSKATLRERESKLLYLFEVMLELRLGTDPRTMDKEEIDGLVRWMRERNLGLAYQAKLWQYMRGLLAFVMDYVGNRLGRLCELGLDRASTEPLFPNGRGAYYSEPGWRMARYKVFRSFGIEANYKVLRASFAQKLKDNGAPIENVSAAL